MDYSINGKNKDEWGKSGNTGEQVLGVLFHVMVVPVGLIVPEKPCCHE